MGEAVETLRAYRFCLDPTDGQRQTLARYAGAARWAFNARLAVLVGGHRRYLQEVAFATYTDGGDEAGARALVKGRLRPDRVRTRTARLPASRRGGSAPR